MRSRRDLVVALVAIAVFATSAHAQTERASSNGLFGRGRLATGGQAQTNFLVSVFEGYDAELRPDAASESTVSESRLGPYSALAANLTFAKSLKKFSVSASADSTLALYPALNDLFTGVSNASFAISGPVGRHARVRATQGGGYRPSYEIAVPRSADREAPAANDVQTFAHDAHFYGTFVGLEVALGRRSSVSLETSVHQFHTADSPAQTSLAVGGRYRQQLTKYAAARIGYARRATAFGRASLSRPLTHDLDGGIDYQRPLSISKRTTVTFQSGSSLVATADGAMPLMTGQVALRREIGRTWTSSAAVGRQVQLLDGFLDPYVATSASAALEGMWGRRVGLQMTAFHSIGTIGFGVGSRGMTTSMASARLSVALSRQVAIASEYAYYDGHSDSEGPALSGLVRGLDRQRVKVGLTVWVPLAP